MEPLKFAESKKNNTLQTIAHVLKKEKYYFKTITPYDNTLFYCYIVREEVDQTKEIFYKLFKWFKYDKPQLLKVERPLSLCLFDNYETIAHEIMIFTRDEIQSIVSDVPENYIGDKIL